MVTRLDYALRLGQELIGYKYPMRTSGSAVSWGDSLGDVSRASTLIFLTFFDGFLMKFDEVMGYIKKTTVCWEGTRSPTPVLLFPIVFTPESRTN